MQVACPGQGCQSLDLFSRFHQGRRLSCVTDGTFQVKGSPLWAVYSTGFLITDNSCKGEQNHAITRQLCIDSEIYRIELKVIVALQLHCSFCHLIFSPCREMHVKDTHMHTAHTDTHTHTCTHTVVLVIIACMIMSVILLNDDNCCLYKNFIYMYTCQCYERHSFSSILGYYNGSVFVLRNLAVNRVLTCVREFIILEIIMLLTWIQKHLLGICHRYKRCEYL